MLDSGGRAASASADAVQRLKELQQKTAQIQHEINNPLAALLAEAQLLAQMPLRGDHRAAAERIVELTRRVVAKVRALDALRDAEVGS